MISSSREVSRNLMNELWFDHVTFTYLFNVYRCRHKTKWDFFFPFGRWRQRKLNKKIIVNFRNVNFHESHFFQLDPTGQHFNTFPITKETKTFAVYSIASSALCSNNCAVHHNSRNNKNRQKRNRRWHIFLRRCCNTELSKKETRDLEMKHKP